MNKLSKIEANYLAWFLAFFRCRQGHDNNYFISNFSNLLKLGLDSANWSSIELSVSQVKCIMEQSLHIYSQYNHDVVDAVRRENWARIEFRSLGKTSDTEKSLEELKSLEATGLSMFENYSGVFEKNLLDDMSRLSEWEN